MYETSLQNWRRTEETSSIAKQSKAKATDERQDDSAVYRLQGNLPPIQRRFNMTSKSGNSSSTSVNAIVQETSADGTITAYKCDYHVKNGSINATSGKNISSYYEMLYPCSENPQQAKKTVASELLHKLAVTFGLLPDGKTCTVPNTLLNVWVIGESSEPLDAIVPNMPCSKLLGDMNSTACCAVVEAPMTFWVADAVFSDKKIMSYLASELNAARLTYKTAYIGSMLDYTGIEGHQHLAPPTYNGIVSQQPSGNHHNHTPSQITLMGGFLMGALIAVLIAGFGVVTYRRRRTQNRMDKLTDEESLDKQSSTDDEENLRKGSLDFLDETNELTGPASSDGRQGMHTDIAFPHADSFGLDDKLQSNEYQPNYAFDIADSMKTYIMGRYGGGTPYGAPAMVVVPPYAMDETSDSEADSWAQTDGTVGSLEERLEEITAEI
jgi:hypothetical protein